MHRPAVELVVPDARWDHGELGFNQLGNVMHRHLSCRIVLRVQVQVDLCLGDSAQHADRAVETPRGDDRVYCWLGKWITSLDVSGHPAQRGLVERPALQEM